MSFVPEFVKQVADKNGQVSVDELLDQVIERFAARTDFSVSPRVAATVFFEIRSDINDGRALLASRQKAATEAAIVEAAKAAEAANGAAK